MWTGKSIVVASALVAAAAAAGPTTPDAVAARDCGRIVNPYPDTRYAGVDLRRIRATGVSCRKARRVARSAHRKALATPTRGPVERFRWRGWRVTGDLRGDSDRYVAKRGERRVSWLF
jgi:hypothetical protein